jgi:hypothetical protein
MSEDPFGIQLKNEPGYWQNVGNSVPVLGNTLKMYEAGKGASEDGATAGEISSVTAEATGLIASCAETGLGIAADPVGWLVGQGLNFLLAVVTPLQDALHYVTGDGPALSAAAESFTNIGRGLETFAQQFDEEVHSSLSGWKGDASMAAAERLGEFAGGIRGTADRAGDIATLLQISSMVMTVIEDFIKALLTELITWLIMIWIPALAAAAPSFGASTAAAGTATAAKGAATAARTTQQVSRLQRLLKKFEPLLEKLKQLLNKSKDLVAKLGQTKYATKLADERFLPRIRQAVTGELGAQVGLPGEPGQPPRISKPLATLENARKAGEYAATGDGQSVEESEENLRSL